MNFVLDNYHVDEKNISFLETKKNNIIDGNFTKIIYKDTFVTVNGIYLLFPVTVTGVDKSNGKTNVFFNPKIASNTSIINHISDIEGKIINCYKQEYNVSYKRNMSTLFNLLYNGKVKLYKEINYNHSRVNLVTYHEFGKKIGDIVDLGSTVPCGAQLRSAKPLLRDFHSCRENNVVRRTESFTTQTHPVASLPDELVVESGVHRTPTLECEALREKLRFSDQNRCCNDQSPTKIVLKISGIWETANEIGITYKFLDMH